MKKKKEDLIMGHRLEEIIPDESIRKKIID